MVLAVALLQKQKTAGFFNVTEFVPIRILKRGSAADLDIDPRRAVMLGIATQMKRPGEKLTRPHLSS